MKIIRTLFLFVLITLVSFRDQNENLATFLRDLKYNLLHNPEKVSLYLNYPFCLFGKKYSRDEHKSIEQFMLRRYIKDNLCLISLNDVIEYEHKNNHPFYKYNRYSICFSSIPSNEKVYEIDIEDEQGHGPAYFILISSSGGKLLIFSFAS